MNTACKGKFDKDVEELSLKSVPAIDDLMLETISGGLDIFGQLVLVIPCHSILVLD